ncbi:VOC family protein [Devosia sp.]|uniref:bleomycin resistance protein n=1 Tax=Devosia sp. TaxID=1871048 RepID=UPI0032659A7B
MQNALIPELAVTDCRHSLQFYCDILGFSVLYQRPEEGFAMLALGEAQLMIDQIDIGRTFGIDDEPLVYPHGRGVNLQIAVEKVTPMATALEAAGIALYLPLEDKWYRRGKFEIGQRQFVVPDPDGYLLRFFEPLGTRPGSRHY